MTIPYRTIQPKPGAEYFLRVAFTLAKDQLWAKKGYEVAAAQFQLPVSAPPAVAAAGKPVSLAQDEKAVTVAGDGFTVVFDKAAGTIAALNRDGVNLLAAGGGPRLHLWRAPHRNDDMWAYDEWVKYGLDNLNFSVVNLAASQAGPNSVRVVAELKAEGKNGFVATHVAAYTIAGDGAIAVDNDVKFAGPRVPLARLGVRLLLDKRLDRFDFLGRGPMENYADRKRGFDVGLYGTGVNEQYAYEKPMERGNHEDVRWAAAHRGRPAGPARTGRRRSPPGVGLAAHRRADDAGRVQDRPAGQRSDGALPQREDAGRGLERLRPASLGEVHRLVPAGQLLLRFAAVAGRDRNQRPNLAGFRRRRASGRPQARRSRRTRPQPLARRFLHEFPARRGRAGAGDRRRSVHLLAFALEDQSDAQPARAGDRFRRSR